jgi:GNAT superfamily N-acetyltransferase
VIEIRPMTEADLPEGMRLKSQNGWNQTEADWRRYLHLQPDGCFVAALGGRAVGTVTTCVFASVGWIAMMLVDPDHRRRGIGRALMTHALEFLERQGVQTVRLDATPLGQPLYERLGFVAEYPLHRHEGILPPGPPAAGVEPLLPHHLDDVLRLDRQVTGTDRRKLLMRLASEFPNTACVACGPDGVEGFLAARPGARAMQLGPCLASERVGRLLLEAARARHGAEQVFIDIPLGNEAAARWAAETGLATQRRLQRMCRGPAIREQVDSLWASSGPEMG